MEPGSKATALAIAVAVHALLLMALGSRWRRSGLPALRHLLWALSTAYFPLIAFVLSYLTTTIWSMEDAAKLWLLILVVLIQFLKAKADMAALAVAAVTSPATADDDVNGLKVRPSTDGLVYFFWVAALLIYNIFILREHHKLRSVAALVSPLWALGALRMVLRFLAFSRAAGSMALGPHSVQLVAGYMAQLQEQLEGGSGEVRRLPAVPRLIVTGESDRDVEETPVGYRVKSSALEAGAPARSSSSLVTLDQVWSESGGDGPLLSARLKDLCLSFALFKCLRRRLAGHRLAEAGSSWALRFVRDGLLGREDDYERVFRVIAGELTFATDFYYAPLPVASLGTLPAAVHFLLSSLILASLVALIVLLVFLIFMVLLFSVFDGGSDSDHLAVLPFVFAVIAVGTEVSEMVAGVRSNWTKISMVGHYIRSRRRCVRGILSCLLRCKAPMLWKDQIGQLDLLAKPKGNRRDKPAIKVPPAVKAAVLSSFRSGGNRLSDGAAAVQRLRDAFRNDLAWACRGGEVATTTDAILVWSTATSLFEVWHCSSPNPMGPPPSAAPAADMLVAVCLSRYCVYLLAEAPDLLPDDATWAKHRYRAVKECVEAAWRSAGGGAADPKAGRYAHLIDSLGRQRAHEVLRKGSRLGKQLVEEVEERRRLAEEEAGPGAGDEERGRDMVWELLAEFWSDMLLYLAPSENVKGHVKFLQRGGELITLLWALLLHAGITGRPENPHASEP